MMYCPSLAEIVLAKTAKADAIINEAHAVVSVREQVAHLEQTLEVREEEAEQAMRTLRQEHERVRITLEAKLKNADPSGHRAVGTGTRVRELERQVTWPNESPTLCCYKRRHWVE